MTNIEFKNGDLLRIEKLIPAVIAGNKDLKVLVDMLVPYVYKDQGVFERKLKQEVLLRKLNDELAFSEGSISCIYFLRNSNSDNKYDYSISIEYASPADYEHQSKVFQIVKDISDKEGIVIYITEKITSLISPKVTAEETKPYEVELE